MYRKGEGVARSPARAFMWFSLAAKRGDAKAKAGTARGLQGHDPGGNLAGPGDVQACEASDYRHCEY